MYARCESQDSGIPSVVQSMISPSRLAGSIPITVSLNEHVYFGKKKKKKRTSVGNIRIFQLAKFPYFYCLNLPFLVGDPPCCNLSTSPGILFCWTQFNFYFFVNDELCIHIEISCLIHFPALFAAREPSMLWYSSISCSADHGSFGRFQSENRPKDFQIWRLIFFNYVGNAINHPWCGEWFIYPLVI